MTPPTPLDPSDNVADDEAPARKGRGSSPFSSSYASRDWRPRMPIINWYAIAYWIVIVICALCRIILFIMCLPVIIIMLGCILIGWTGWDRPIRTMFTSLNTTGSKGTVIGNRNF